MSTALELAQRQDLAQQSNLVSLSAAIKELSEQGRTVHAEAQRSTTQAIAELQQRLAGARQELIKAHSVTAQQTLIAPVDGVVQQLKVHTVGGAVAG
jgi:hemolysin D